jgi:putative colanic acid biosynthesis acetyltransferase WcaF
VDLSSFSGGRFNRGAGVGKEFLWIMVSLFLFRFCPFKLSGTKSVLLRLFGAKVGRGMVIKPNVKITFPWKLTLGDNVWLGEECWLLNLERITVADNVCISQRAFLCTGNHNYKSPSFDLIVKPIEIQEGVWIGASAWVGPGVTVGSHAMLAAGSVATTDLQPFGIYQGNPALLVKTRVLNDPPSGKV